MKSIRRACAARRRALDAAGAAFSRFEIDGRLNVAE
jgi:hypothetical protein